MTNQTETTEPEACDEAGGQVERVVICNIERYGIGLCGKPANWKHPRWTTGTYCDEHKKKLENFWPDDWSQVDNA